MDVLTTKHPVQRLRRMARRAGTAVTRAVASLAGAVSLCFACAPLAEAAPVHDMPLEYQVKASYLYNFMRFVSWPEQGLPRDGKFNLCVTGAERFGGGLDALAGEPIEGRPIVVRKLASVGEVRRGQCQVLFIAGEDWGSPVIGDIGLLTVGETPGFLERGGVINLIDVQGRIRFEINQEAARRSGLTLSSRLLRLAMERR